MKRIGRPVLQEGYNPGDFLLAMALSAKADDVDRNSLLDRAMPYV